MAETTPQVSETFEAKPEAKQFNLTNKFDDFAKSKGLSEQGIKLARAEIQDRFTKFNAEGMDSRRFNNLLRTIDGMVNNEIAKAQSLLASRSEALAGTSVKPAASVQQVAYSVPENKPANPNLTPDKGTVTGLFNAIPVTRNATNKRDAALRAAGA